MKRPVYLYVLTACFLLVALAAEATVKVTPASGGSVLADFASDSASPAWTTLGPISITERKKNDIASGSNLTLVLRAPTGFEFNTGTAPDISFTAGRDISSATAAIVNSLTLRLTFTATGTAGFDTLTISNLQVRASFMSPLARGNIVRPAGASGGTAVISGIKAESSKGKGSVTVFGALTEIAGAATQLGIRAQPSTNVVAATVFGRQPVIAVEDSGGNVRLSDNGRVITAAISSGPGTLSGTLTAVTVNGLATFTNLSLSDPGEVILTFSTSNLTEVASALIQVFPGPPPPAVATSLSIQTQPSASNVAGTAFSQQPVVMILDQYDLPYTNENNAYVTAANLDATDPLQGTLSVKVVNGVATFTNLFHTNATDLSIQFTSTNLNSTVSDVITINPGAAKRLVFDVQPDLAGVGKPFGIQPIVLSQDLYGNDSASGLGSSLNVTMNLTSGTGTLNGTTVLDIGTNDGNGVVMFTDLSISTQGDKQLTASASGLSNAISVVFTVLPKTNQTITSFTDIPAKVYGDGSFTLSATASSGLPVSFSIISGPATISNSTVTLTGAGNVVARASQSGNVDYLAAPSIDQEFTVLRKAASVTANDASRNYGDINPAFTGSSITGLTNGDVITPTFSSSAVASSVPGTYPITISLVDPGNRQTNYIVTKHNGTLTINSVPPIIDTQPQDQTVGQGSPATFSIGVSGPLLAFQWKFNGTNINGETASTLTLPNVQSSQAGTYSVVVTNGSGSVTSSNAVLQVIPVPVIVAQPTSFHTTAGANFTLPVSTNVGFIVTGAQPFSYQWRKDGNTLATQTTSALKLLNAKTTNSGNYSVIIANVAGSVTSAPISVIVGAVVAPKIITNLSNQDVVLGDPVDFTIVATGPALSYQWYYNGDPLVGETKSTFHIASAQFTDAGTYHVTVTNVAGALTSSNSVLTVNYDPNVITNDVDLDGNVDILVQSTNSFLGIWNLDHTNYVGSFLLNDGLPLTPGWLLTGKGDFNHDNKTDYVFQNGGFMSVWLMDGTNLINSVALNTNAVKAPWKVMGARDFNRDGNTDIILRHSNGATLIWLMRGTKILKSVPVRGMGKAYQLVGMDDFNKDGNVDLLWHNPATGKIYITYMIRARFKKAAFLKNGPTPTKAWNAVGLVDIDGANSRDILWQNKTNSTLMTWYLNGTNVVGTNMLNFVVPGGWSIVGEK